jgi:hypothetical protein
VPIQPAVSSRHIVIGTACVLTCLAASMPVIAVPYASGVERVGDTVSFTLNEPADTVTITRNYNDTFLVLNDVAAGAHSFDIAGTSNYTISVTHSAPVGWAESVSSIGNLMLGFERANGVAVNTNPGSPNFGRFYVSQRDASVSYAGRQMGDGIYVFNADATDAFGITDPNDANAARTGGLDFSASPGSPFHISVGPDDTLYIGDASDVHGGIYYADPDVSTGGNLLAGLGGVQPIVGQNHGSIISTPLVSGSLSTGDLVLYTIDQDLPGSVPDTGSHVWRYDIGGSNNYAGTPTLVVDASTLGNNSDGSSILIASDGGTFDLPYSNPTRLTDITRDPRTGNFIIMQLNRGVLIMDPTFSTILFNSRQFYIDNAPEYDLFQNIVSAQVSPDGQTLFFRNYVSANVLVASLDDNGLPILNASAGSLLGLESFDAPAPYFGTPRGPIAYDLAGNIYTAGNRAADERLGIYGPGGDSAAITRSNGTFTINGTTYGDGYLAGDLNGDGFVGIEDLSIVLGNWNQAVAHGVFTLGDPSGDGFVGIEDLNAVLGNWNTGTPPGTSAPADIPEPGALALLALGSIALTHTRIRTRREGHFDV